MERTAAANIFVLFRVFAPWWQIKRFIKTGLSLLAVKHIPGQSLHQQL
jgi:hypothetical protein